MKGYHDYERCIQACLNCAALCNNCASACTEEDDMRMITNCIRITMECATVCYATAQLLNMGSSSAKDICRICAHICEACSDECSRYDTDHCQECAAACKQCAEECRLVERPVEDSVWV